MTDIERLTANLECALDETGVPDAACQEAVALIRSQAARIAELEAEREEALRRRDAWKARAEGHVEIVDALRAKTTGRDSRTLSKALLGAAFREAEDRADALARENERMREALVPFAAAVFNDNGDVTLDYSHVKRSDYLRARAAVKGETP